MAKQTTQSVANDIQKLFDPQGSQDVLKTWTSIDERLMSLAAEAGIRATDIANGTAKETLSNMLEPAQVREEPADYGKAYADFVQKQVELFTRAAQAYATETQKVGGETAELASKTGEEMTGKVAANTEGAVKTARSAAKKAA